MAGSKVQDVELRDPKDVEVSVPCTTPTLYSNKNTRYGTGTMEYMLHSTIPIHIISLQYWSRPSGKSARVVHLF